MLTSLKANHHPQNCENWGRLGGTATSVTISRDIAKTSVNTEVLFCRLMIWPGAVTQRAITREGMGALTADQE